MGACSSRPLLFMADFSTTCSVKRMLCGIAFSLLVHALLLASLGGVMLYPGGKGSSPQMLAVRIQVLPAKPSSSEPVFYEKTVMQRTHSSYRIPAQAPVEAPPPEPVAVAEASVADATRQGPTPGFGLPRSIGLPWIQNLSVRPVRRHENPAEAYRAMHEAELATMQKQARQLQRAAALSAELTESMKSKSGYCTVTQADTSSVLLLDCEPAVLEQTLREKHMDALALLFGTGDDAGVFGITFRDEQVQVFPVPRPIK